jgi:hypothetical protein
MLGMTTPVFADFFLDTPNGNPTGPYYAVSPPGYIPGYQVFVQPATTAMVWTETVSIFDVLGAQGYSAANGWTIGFFGLSGKYQLDTYYAWTETSPAITQGSMTLDSTSLPGRGGALIGLSYHPQGNDPTAGVHWLQVVVTNDPQANAIGVTDGGLTYHLDNLGNVNNSPFYDDAGGAANATDFIDSPYRPYSATGYWRGYALVATGDLQNKQIQLATQGVYYGFDDPIITTPAPAPPGLMLAIPAFAMIVWRYRKLRGTPPESATGA